MSQITRKDRLLENGFTRNAKEIVQSDFFAWPVPKPQAMGVVVDLATPFTAFRVVPPIAW
jgi:hypothetical protein